MAAVILGIGNLLLGDEGAGVHAVRYLQRHYPDHNGTCYIDGGTIGFPLAGELSRSNSLVVIDAAQLGIEDGGIELFEGEAMDQFIGRRNRNSVHEIGLRDLLSTSQLLGELPRHRALVGIQPESVSWGEHPSGAVAEAIPRACKMALDLIKRWQS